MSNREPFAILTQKAAEAAKETIDGIIDDFRAVCESPIEELLLASLAVYVRQGNAPLDDVLINPTDHLLKLRTPTPPNLRELIVQTQQQVGDWRVDFLVHYFDWGYPNSEPCWRRVIVECDGHEFHERTKAQAKRDRRRDRAAQYSGTPVLRFTGSEIWNDPWGCAEQIVAFYEKGL